MLAQLYDNYKNTSHSKGFSGFNTLGVNPLLNKVTDIKTTDNTKPQESKPDQKTYTPAEVNDLLKQYGYKGSKDTGGGHIEDNQDDTQIISNPWKYLLIVGAFIFGGFIAKMTKKR
jgi:hypothetical protein